ncbi:MAG: hypothetical protein ABI193_00920 [Minicystis sp.]
MDEMKPHTLILAFSGGLLVFAAGVGSARFFGAAPPPAPPSAASSLVVSPKIVFDPDSINLLPDASLHLDLPRGFDAGDGGDR